MPLIVVAESCSWASVLSTSNLGHVVEESIWGASAALLVLGFAGLWPRCAPAVRPVIALWCVAGVAYVVYMFCIDVPMYAARWLADEAHGKVYLSLAQGVSDAARRVLVSHAWDDWKSEVAWMSL